MMPEPSNELVAYQLKELINSLARVERKIDSINGRIVSLEQWRAGRDAIRQAEQDSASSGWTTRIVAAALAVASSALTLLATGKLG